MFNGRPPKQPPHLPIYTKAINGYHDHGIHAITVAPPLEAMRMGNTVAIRLPSVAGIRRCRNTEGDVIPAMTGTVPGSGAVTFYAWDGTNKTLSSETATVYNDGLIAGTDDVPAAAEMFVYREFGVWWVLGWWCDS